MNKAFYSGRIPQEPLMLTLCLEQNSILISKATLDALEQPKQIQMLINEERKTLLLQSCTTEGREAVVIPPLAMNQFEMSGHALLKRIRRLTGWADNRPRVIYGNYMPFHKVIVFQLNEAKLAELQIPLDEGGRKN